MSIEIKNLKEPITHSTTERCGCIEISSVQEALGSTDSEHIITYAKPSDKLTRTF